MTITIKIEKNRSTVEVTGEIEDMTAGRAQRQGGSKDEQEQAIAYLLGSYARDLYARPADETIHLARVLMRNERAVRAAEQAIDKAKKG